MYFGSFHSENGAGSVEYSRKNTCQYSAFWLVVVCVMGCGLWMGVKKNRMEKRGLEKPKSEQAAPDGHGN